MPLILLYCILHGRPDSTTWTAVVQALAIIVFSSSIRRLVFAVVTVIILRYHRMEIAAGIVASTMKKFKFSTNGRRFPTLISQRLNALTLPATHYDDPTSTNTIYILANYNIIIIHVTFLNDMLWLLLLLLFGLG